MKINLIGTNFNLDSGQGVYKYSGEILKRLTKTKNLIVINESGKINHVQQPELIWHALFKKNVVTTFHDVIPLLINERKKLFNLFFRISVFLAVIKSKKIITVSECTKNDLIKFYPRAEKKIEVIYEGVSAEFFPITGKKSEFFPVIGYVGGLGKRKNIEFILKVAKIMPKIKFKIGGTGPHKEKLLELSKKLNLKNVEFVGFIPEKEINKFYNSLNLFIFPSLYEGFGLPVVEAMACGTPCVISNQGSLPEIIGNAGIILDLKNLEMSRERILNLIKNKNKLKELSKKSIKRAKYFDWDKCVKKTLGVYEKCLKR